MYYGFSARQLPHGGRHRQSCKPNIVDAAGPIDVTQQRAVVLEVDKPDARVKKKTRSQSYAVF